MLKKEEDYKEFSSDDESSLCDLNENQFKIQSQLSVKVTKSIVSRTASARSKHERENLKAKTSFSLIRQISDLEASKSFYEIKNTCERNLEKNSFKHRIFVIFLIFM